jgi:hypothetical protein
VRVVIDGANAAHVTLERGVDRGLSASGGEERAGQAEGEEGSDAT